MVLVLLSVATLVSASHDWRWGPPLPQYDGTTGDLKLTNENGSGQSGHVVSNCEDWYARVIPEDGYDHSIWVLPLTDGGLAHAPVRPDANSAGDHACVLISTGHAYLGALWHKTSDGSAWFSSAEWPGLYENDWDIDEAVSGRCRYCARAWRRLHHRRRPVYLRMLSCSSNWRIGRRVVPNTGRGEYGWGTPVPISSDPADQIAMSTGDPTHIFVAYHYKDGETHKIKVWRSDDWGISHSTQVSGSPWEDVAQPRGFRGHST